MAWQFTPFYMVYFIAGYGNIDTTIYEAAIIDGATRWQYIKNIARSKKQPVKNNSLQIFVFGKLTVTLYRLNQNDEK